MLNIVWTKVKSTKLTGSTGILKVSVELTLWAINCRLTTINYQIISNYMNS